MKKIFCIEDDDEIRELILYALKSGGYDAVGFSETSKVEFAGGNPDLILLDVMLPHTDGIEYLRQLKSGARREIPVILLTAKSSEIDKVTGLDEGADDYITKPFGVMELLSRIRAVLRRSCAGEGDTVTVDAVTLNIPSREVRVNGERVELTMREFDVLELLMKNAGRVVTREMLMTSVWGYDFEGVTRTVDMHIKTIRQKLKAAGAGDFIVTVRGVGYKAGVI